MDREFHRRKKESWSKRWIERERERKEEKDKERNGEKFNSISLWWYILEYTWEWMVVLKTDCLSLLLYLFFSIPFSYARVPVFWKNCPFKFNLRERLIFIWYDIILFIYIIYMIWYFEIRLQNLFFPLSSITGRSVRIHSPLTDCVLFTPGRNHSTNITGCSLTW